MNLAITGIGAVVVFTLGVTVGSLREEPAPPAAGKAAGVPQERPAPKPLPQHEMLAKEAGTWSAKAKVMGMEFPATETIRMLPGGLWQIGDYTQGDGKFTGHGVFGYDAYKQKFVGVWVDNQDTQLQILEGTLDKAGKVLTMQTTVLNPDTKKPMTMTEVTTFKDDTHRTFQLSMPMPGTDGALKDTAIVDIEYTKQK